MQFLIDENLPPALAISFREQGLEAIHINEFGVRKPIKDDGIRRYLLRHPNVIIVTRDDDFVKSYFSRKVPERLIYVFNLEKREEILYAFNKHLIKLSGLIPDHKLIEINPEGLKVHI